MYPDAEDEIKIDAWKNVLSSLYEHVRTCKICHTYLNAILEHAVKNKKQYMRFWSIPFVIGLKRINGKSANIIEYI